MHLSYQQRSHLVILQLEPTLQRFHPAHQTLQHLFHQRLLGRVRQLLTLDRGKQVFCLHFLQMQSNESRPKHLYVQTKCQALLFRQLQSLLLLPKMVSFLLYSSPSSSIYNCFILVCIEFKSSVSSFCATF